jgi:hypothetical protein
MRSADEIEAALQKLDLKSFDLPYEIEGALEGLAEVPDRELLFPTIFRFMEQNPQADFGSPGPVVHILEDLGGYEPALLASVQRTPISHTLWMINRILNSLLPESERKRWRAALERVAHDEATPPDVREKLWATFATRMVTGSGVGAAQPGVAADDPPSSLRSGGGSPLNTKTFGRRRGSAARIESPHDLPRCARER